MWLLLQWHTAEDRFGHRCLVDVRAMSIYSQPDSKGGIMGPFHMPWLTFSALIVIAGSILLAIGWSVWGFRKGEDQ